MQQTWQARKELMELKSDAAGEHAVTLYDGNTPVILSAERDLFSLFKTLKQRMSVRINKPITYSVYPAMLNMVPTSIILHVLRYKCPVCDMEIFAAMGCEDLSAQCSACGFAGPIHTWDLSEISIEEIQEGC